MSYILFDSDLHKIIKEETRPAVSDDGDIDIPYLVAKRSCLTSVYHEVLWLIKRNNVFRRVTRDMEIEERRSTLVMPLLNLLASYMRIPLYTALIYINSI
jgi:hypothetical protein